MEPRSYAERVYTELVEMDRVYQMLLGIGLLAMISGVVTGLYRIAILWAVLVVMLLFIQHRYDE